MVRTVKLHAERRDEILDVAQELFYSKGYEQASIQEIIDTVGIAKGTFYHYFSSKSQLLDEIIGRMMAHTDKIVEPIVNDENINALQKFHLFFRTIENWKIDNIAFFKSILSVFYHDDNTLLRQKLKAASKTVYAAPLSQIIRQGIDEGVFKTQDPDNIGVIIIEIGQSLGEHLALLLLDAEISGTTYPTAERKITVYQFAMEQLLGAPAGSIHILELDRLRQWFE